MAKAMQNVFGAAVTEESLKQMPEYQSKMPLRLELARAALLSKNASGKDVAVLRYVEGVGNTMGDDGTQCVLYNATGGPVTLIAFKHWSGTIYQNAYYPTIIENGQWGGFVLTHNTSLGCVSDVVYGGKNASGAEVQYVLGSRQVNNEPLTKCFTEVRPTGYYTNNPNQSAWKDLDAARNRSSFVHEVADRGCKIYASIGNTYSPLFEGILTLNGA